jgi:hypothetical protein
VSEFIAAHPAEQFELGVAPVAAAPARSAGVAVAGSSSKSHKCDSEASGIKFFTLDRERQKRLRHATQPVKLAALHEEKKARRWCIAHGYCVAYYTHDRKFFTWHLYPSQAAVLAHVDYLNFVFRAHGGCPPIAKLRLQGRLWTASEKLAFERRAYGI